MITFGPQVTLEMRRYALFAACHIKLEGEVHIEITSEVMENGSYGLCWGDNSPVEIQLSTRSDDHFISPADILKTLGHELVHAKQYIEGYLVTPDEEDQDGVETWHGLPYNYKAEDEAAMPWEVEANFLENEIYQRYIEADMYSISSAITIRSYQPG